MATDTLLPGAAIRAHGRGVAAASTLLRAQQESLNREERIATLDLRPVNGKTGIDVADRLLSIPVRLTMEGASELTLRLHDPEREIERSQLLDKDRNGRLDAAQMSVDRLRWRLVQVSRPENSTLIDVIFEDEVWALLRAHRGPLAVSRNAVTRAQFIERELIREITFRDVPFFAPDKGRRQPIKLPDYPDAAPAPHSTGFDKGTKLNVKGPGGSKMLGPEEMRNAATMLAVAEQEEAGEKATLALIEAGIVEAPFFYNNPGGDATSVGVLQLLDIHLGGSTSAKGGRRDVGLVSHLFLTKGFWGKGGAIALARAHPDWSAGQVAQNVQGSAFPGRYDQAREGALAVIKAWSGEGPSGDAGTSTHEAVRVKGYRFTRGLPGQSENSAQCAVRLADEVQWRFFISGGIAWFVTDEYLLTRAADLVLEGYDASGLLGWPGYQWDHRKLAASVTLPVAANAWSVRPGSIVALRDMGSPLDGRWIVESFEFDLLKPLEGTVTLTKPIRPKKEPAPEVFTVTVDEHGNTVTDDGIDASSGGKSVGNGLTYPLAIHGSDLGGVAAHMARAFGNWQSDNAVDIGVPMGTNVYAVDDGTITKLGGSWDGTGNSNPNGYNVTLTTKDNAWFYTHLKSRANLSVGDKVSAGKYFGESGAANGVKHLHLGCQHGDPESLLKVKGGS